jgi:hypothetical protein
VRGNPVERGEGGAHASRIVRARRKPPCRDNFVADILVNRATGFRDSERHIGYKAVEQTEITEFPEALGDGGRGAHIDEKERALFDPGIVISPGGEGEQYAWAEEVVNAEEEDDDDHQHKRNDEVEGPDCCKASPRRRIDEGDDEDNGDDVKDRAQQEIGQKRQRPNEAAGVASQHQSFERKQASRQQGTGQTAAHRRSVPGPGVGRADQETGDDAPQQGAKIPDETVTRSFTMQTASK